jgi:hypothetical protein
VAAMTNVEACYGALPTGERPPNDKYAFLCVFHTSLFSTLAWPPSLALLKRDHFLPRNKLYYCHKVFCFGHEMLKKITFKLCTFFLDSSSSSGGVYWGPPDVGSDSFWYLSPFGSPVTRFGTGYGKNYRTRLKHFHFHKTKKKILFSTNYFFKHLFGVCVLSGPKVFITSTLLLSQ